MLRTLSCVERRSGAEGEEGDDCRPEEARGMEAPERLRGLAPATRTKAA